MKKNSLLVLFAVPVLILLVIFCVILPALKVDYGHINVKVCDAFTLSPLENAYIVLPHSGLSAFTCKSGTAAINGIPIKANKILDELYEPSCAQIVLIAYCDGYIPYALLYLNLYPGQMRTFTIYMFPDDGSGLTVSSVIETPPEEWLNGLANKYAP